MLLFLTLTLNSFASELYMKYQWETTPTIEICPDSNIKVNQIIEALNFWNVNGVEVPTGTIKHVKHCSPHRKNTIQFMGNRNLERHENAEALVSWYYYGEKTKNTVYYINLVEVQIPNNILDTRQDVVFHEIGHALGLGHSNHAIMKSHQ